MASKLHLIGGYGEHGRSCFLLERPNGRYLMVDCGILDTDPQPYPVVSDAVLQATDYLFLTHCHKDHTGALGHFVSRGFQGTVVTEEITAHLVNLGHLSVELLHCQGRSALDLGDIHLTYGRSGHCIGSLWFHIQVDGGTYFFSGDYQQHTLVNACDPAVGLVADYAVVDCGHEDIPLTATQCHSAIAERISLVLSQRRTLILPVQQYGRGLEILWLLHVHFPHVTVGADDSFLASAKKSMDYPRSFRGEVYPQLCTLVEGLQPIVPQSMPQIILLGDTHMEGADSQQMLSKLGTSAFVLSTGRVKPEGVIRGILDRGEGAHIPYSHHQSEPDFRATVAQNHFGTTYPFHGHSRRVVQ